jgi:hypothetical protein
MQLLCSSSNGQLGELKHFSIGKHSYVCFYIEMKQEQHTYSFDQILLIMFKSLLLNYKHDLALVFLFRSVELKSSFPCFRLISCCTEEKTSEGERTTTLQAITYYNSATPLDPWPRPAWWVEAFFIISKNTFLITFLFWVETQTSY